MINCWASSLSNCCETQSREHIISKSLFPQSKSIFIEGFPWCINEQMEVGLASLTSKILCKHHNSNLSELDSAAGHAFNSFEYISKLVKDANESNGRFKVKKTHINALLLERWLLKTLINICYEKNFLIGSGVKQGVPDDNLVRICFGKSKFLGGSGMYFAAKEGDLMGFGSHLTVVPIIEESENRVVACMFKFAGLLMFLWLIPEVLPNNFDWIKHGKPEWLNLRPSRPFKKMKFKIPSGDTHTLHFNWQ